MLLMVCLSSTVLTGWFSSMRRKKSIMGGDYVMDLSQKCDKSKADGLTVC